MYQFSVKQKCYSFDGASATAQIRGFEGPEKRLLAEFFPTSSHANGLRSFNAKKWQELLDLAKCTIISQTSNDYFDSYVLSESSLFVYPTKVLLKTCGTTTLLHCVEKLLEFAGELDLEVKRIVFSRKNYVFPEEQQAPHNDWNNEVVHLNAIFDGEAHIIGPLTGEHWFVYVADYSLTARASPDSSDGEEEAAEAGLPALTSNSDDSASSGDDDPSGDESCGCCPADQDEAPVTLEVMMHGLDPAVCRSFYRSASTGERDKYAGVAELLPGSITDEFNFAPCGYSMNGLRGPAYSTIHVTPEVHCSYASYETNACLLPAQRLELVRRVLELFQPTTATVTLFTSSHASARQLLPFELSGSSRYLIRHQSRTTLEAHCSIHALTLQRAPAVAAAGGNYKARERLDSRRKAASLSSLSRIAISV